MNSNKKTFNYTILFVVVYVVLALIILAWIWWPSDSKTPNTKFKYEDVDEGKKALNIYTSKIKSLLAENDLPFLYSKLDANYKSQYNINENNYVIFLEQANYISKNINITDATINIQDNDVYVYRFTYTCNNRKCYVNLIETKPYEYTLSFEQETIPIANNSSNDGNGNNIGNSNSNVTKTTTIDDIKYEVSKTTIRENGITYTLKITNNSDKDVYYNFDNITNVSVIMGDGKIANLGGAVISSDEDSLTPNSYLEKELFFPVSSTDQNKIKTIRIQNVKIGDEKKTVNISI